MIGTMSGDLTEFQRWATGNLVENRNRGIYGEWLVGQALGVIGDDEVRQEWDAVDLAWVTVGIAGGSGVSGRCNARRAFRARP